MALLAVSALSIQAGAVSNIVAFGDSLTDDCTHGASALIDSVLDTNQVQLQSVYAPYMYIQRYHHTTVQDAAERLFKSFVMPIVAASLHQIPPDCVLQLYPGAPYYEGCIFSSGPPYSMVAAGLLNATLTDYAIGGATSGAVPGYLEVPASYTNGSSPAVVEVPSSIEQVFEEFKVDLLIICDTFTTNRKSANIRTDQLQDAVLCDSIRYLEVYGSGDCPRGAPTINIPRVLLQVANYLSTTNGTASPDALYIVFIGANDYLDTLAGEQNATVEEVLTATAEAMDTLYQAGARV